MSLLWPAALDITPLLRLDVPALQHLRLESEPRAVMLASAAPASVPGPAHTLHALFPDAAAAPLQELHVVALGMSPHLFTPPPSPRFVRLRFGNCTGAGAGAL